MSAGSAEGRRSPRVGCRQAQLSISETRQREEREAFEGRGGLRRSTGAVEAKAGGEGLWAAGVEWAPGGLEAARRLD